jgi:hypothetical protein
VFLGELDNRKGEVTGMHNWLQFAAEEAKVGSRLEARAGAC